MYKRILINLIVGAVGGLLAAMLVINYRLPTFIVSSPSFQDKLRAEITQNTKKITPGNLVSLDFWQSVSDEASLTTVAVEAFKDNNIIRQGTGVIVSSDGLIVTTIDVATQADSYQILSADKVSRAQVVWRDYSKNLALLKIDALDLSVSDLGGSGGYTTGSDVIINGKIINLSKEYDFSQKALVSYVMGSNIVLDTSLNFYLSGSKAVNSRGQTIGILSLRYGKVNLIDSSVVDGFVKDYFARKNN